MINDQKYLKYIESRISDIQTELIGKSRTAELLDLRYLSGQLHEALTMKTMYIQLRREGEDASG